MCLEGFYINEHLWSNQVLPSSTEKKKIFHYLSFIFSKRPLKCRRVMIFPASGILHSCNLYLWLFREFSTSVSLTYPTDYIVSSLKAVKSKCLGQNFDFIAY